MEYISLQQICAVPGGTQAFHVSSHRRFVFHTVSCCYCSDSTFSVYSSVIFILRLYSIYGGSMRILVAISLLLLAELGVKIVCYALTEFRRSRADHHLRSGHSLMERASIFRVVSLGRTCTAVANICPGLVGCILTGKNP